MTTIKSIVGAGAVLTALLAAGSALAYTETGFNDVREQRAMQEAGGSAYGNIQKKAVVVEGVGGRAGTGAASQGSAGKQSISRDFDSERTKRGMQEAGGAAYVGE